MAETTTCPMISPSVLAAFCTDEATAFNVATPWRDGDRVYATDGRIAIELSRDTRPFEPGEGRRPEVERMITEEFSREVAKLDTPVPDAGEKPPHADANWYTKRPCPICSYMAIKVAAGDLPADTQGGDYCTDCDEGWEWYAVENASERIPCGDWEYQRRYLWAVNQLPNVRCSVRPGDGLMLFEFDGGRGLLMAMEWRDATCSS